MASRESRGIRQGTWRPRLPVVVVDTLPNEFLPAASACWSISTPCKKVQEEQTTNHSFKSEGDQIFLNNLVV